MMHEEEAIEAESADSFDGDSAYAGSSGGSLTETLASEIARGVEENGRTYAAYGKEEYGLPIDEEELDRIDMSHAKYVMLMEKKLFLAPITEQPQKILDLGTGTGIWAIDIANLYPSADVLGLDIAGTQPEWVPPNCRFQVIDIEDPVWTLQKDSYDFIHARDLLLAIRDWPRLVKQSFDHIKPGGYFELQCIFPRLCCDDETLDLKNQLLEFTKKALNASAKMGISLDACTQYAKYMRDVGFEDIVERRYKMPSSPWPKDKRMKLIGAFEMHNLLGGLSAMSLWMFSRALGMTQIDIENFLVDVKRDTKNLKCGLYSLFPTLYRGKTTDRH
ncbi:S-adenosyl-L-methionine-dependent methyltransferase [Amylocarpus encephaloides]|uniref:S-adenosyl-L-methionine-dependent methyltransferase n=1 Tax=Amylocarpus encephaloides TaxID=45428 RepID=A0A9P7YM84_9HELO|nr:S-adenosyl-L-methionine-dependent methyltransferase [Amylocarpus encephaloides]